MILVSVMFSFERMKKSQCSCFQVGEMCGQIWAGLEKRHKQSSTPGFGPWPEKKRQFIVFILQGNSEGMQDVLICINIFPKAFLTVC